MTIRDPVQQSMLRAAQTLHTAAGLAGTDAQSDPSRSDTEWGVETLLWLSASLLPEGLSLRTTSSRPGRVGDLLRVAENELRRFPIGSYPDGTIDLVVGLCDLIRRSSGERS